MRRVMMAILVVLVVFGSSLSAQTAAAVAATAQQGGADTVVVKKSDLTADQLARISQQQQQQQVKESLGIYEEYGAMGRGVGAALGEGLRSVKDVAVELSETRVGKFAMFLIAWRVMAKDILDMGNTV